jgi:biopolymer transport protein TolQ
MNAVLATGLMYSFSQSDLQGKIIVVILMLGSALTWTVMLTKWQQLRRIRRSAEQFLSHFRRDRDPLHLFINNFEMPENPYFNIYRMGAEEVSTQFGNNTVSRKPTGAYKTLGDTGGGQLMMSVDAQTEVRPAERTVISVGTLRGALARAVDAEVIRMEHQVAVLSTAVQGGPFLGLLGSAWGVMSVFGEMGVHGTVHLTAVAPGISAALLATVVGLLVAVPSLFAYNWLASAIRRETMQMEGFAEEFVAAIEHNYITN